MTICPPRCTCAEREHACSPPCPAHPERGGGLGNPGTAFSIRAPIDLEEFFDGPIEFTDLEMGFSDEDVFE